MFYYLVATTKTVGAVGKILAKYGCQACAVRHKERLEKDLKWQHLEIHASTKNLVKNQVLKVSDIHI